MLVYPSGIDVSTSTLRYLSARLWARRQERGTRWRRLSSGRQALLVLAHLRSGHTYAQLAAGFGVGTTTAYRYIAEAIEVLADLAPTLAKAMKTASTKAFVILDGTLLPIDRIAADQPFYSGKHKKHGMNVQVLTDPHGRLLWASPALPGAVHDIKAARTHGIIDALDEAGVECWADKAYRGAGGTIRVPYWGAGRHFPQASRPSTAPTPRSARSSSRPWPPSRPGDSCASCDARPPASPPSFRPSSPCTWPAQTEGGKRSLRLVADTLGVAVERGHAEGEFACARRRTDIAAGTLDQETVAAQRITVVWLDRDRPVLRFRANWYCTTELDRPWDLRETGWRLTVDGDAPLEVAVRFPVDPERAASVFPSYTANHAVNAVPWVCEAPAGIRTTADLPQIVPHLG